LFRKRINASVREEQIVEVPSALTYPNDVSSDGNRIVYMENLTGDNFNVNALQVAEGRSDPLLATKAAEHLARFSPDERWVAYGSDESGRFEVYVQAASGHGVTKVVSVSGGDVPRWKADGKELFYTSGDSAWAVPVLTTSAADIEFGTPQKLFSNPRMGGWPAPTPNGTLFDAAPDGQSFVLDLIKEPAGQQPISVIVNWPSLVAR
jgi:Tol biopolymer transport system component